jgi:hypothetical protein
MDMVGFVGNAVGALAVRIICKRESVEPVPLYKFITALLKQRLSERRDAVLKDCNHSR